MTRQRITLFLDPELIKRSRAAALENDESLSNLVERLLDTQLPKAIFIAQPAQNASDQDKLKLDQVEQYVSQYNAGTVGLATISEKPLNSLAGSVTQKMAESLQYVKDGKTER